MDRYYCLLKKHVRDGKFVCRYCGFKQTRQGVYALTEEKHSYRLPRQGQTTSTSGRTRRRLAPYRGYYLPQVGYYVLGWHFICRNCQAVRTRKPSGNRKGRLLRRYGSLTCWECNLTTDNPVVFEEHHIYGHHVGPMRLFCLNCHAIETERQRQGILNGIRYPRFLESWFDGYEKEATPFSPF